MRNFFGTKFKEYVGLVTYAIVFTYIVFNINGIMSGASSIIEIISPFIMGIAIAFILNLLMKIIENKGLKFLDTKGYEKFSAMKRPLAVASTFIIVIVLFVALITFIIPQLIDSISTLTDAIPGYLNSFEELINKYIASTDILNTLWSKLLEVWQDVLQVTGQIIANSLSGVVGITVNLTSSLVNFVLALVFSIYMLSNKERLQLSLKKILYAILKKNHAEKLLYLGKVSNKAFASYIGGQCTEAVIIGVLCFLGLLVLRMPYPLLISVLVGVTSLIPIFGAFIGTIPSAFIILIIDPKQAVWFVVFIIVLQQIEGNLIYPRVVGESVGLPPIWVMLAMLIGGSTFGLLGMLLGIPTFAVIYKITREVVDNRLKNKNIQIDK